MSVNIYKNNQLISIAEKSSGGGGGGGSTWLSKSKVLNKNNWTNIVSESKITNYDGEVSSIFTFKNKLYYITYIREETTSTGYLYEWVDDTSWEIISVLPENFISLSKRIFIYNDEVHLLGGKRGNDSLVAAHYVWDGLDWREITSLSTIFAQSLPESAIPIVYNNTVRLICGSKDYEFNGTEWSEIGDAPSNGTAYLVIVSFPSLSSEDVEEALLCVQNNILYRWDESEDESSWQQETSLPSNFEILDSINSPVFSSVFTTSEGSLPTVLTGVIGVEDGVLKLYILGNTESWKGVDIVDFEDENPYSITYACFNNKVHFFNLHDSKYYYVTYDLITDELEPISEMPVTTIQAIQNFIYKDQIHLLLRTNETPVKELLQYWYENGEWTDGTKNLGCKQIISDSDFYINANAIVGLSSDATKAHYKECSQCELTVSDFKQSSGNGVGLSFSASKIPNINIPINILIEQNNSN